ncbi:hypothetical protein [Micromonospora nigra]|nr:hypothetical protein [Micromonospora nigra]
MLHQQPCDCLVCGTLVFEERWIVVAPEMTAERVWAGALDDLVSLN